MSDTTGTEAVTLRLEDGERVYLCRCGETHRGEYALYDYGHHLCFHPSPLIDTGIGQVLCGMCGNSWEVKPWDQGGDQESRGQ